MNMYSKPSFNRIARYLPVAAIALVGVASQAATYNIPHNGITNHGNASVTGSIAWYFAQYGSNDTYVLTSNSVYQIGTTLNVPSSSTLKDTGSAELRATSGIDNSIMIKLNNSSKLDGLKINGRNEAKTVIWAQGKSGPQVNNCTVSNAKNDYPAGNNTSVRLLDFANTSSALIHNNSIYNAGYPKINASLGTGYGVYARGSTNLTIQYNGRISHTLAAGIDITDVITATVKNNTVYDTGLNVDYGQGAAADGVTGYHHSISSPETTKLFWSIKDNYFHDARNHGLHVSGREIVLDDNTVLEHRQRGIALFDWRSPVQYSRDVDIINNTSESGYGTTGQDEPVYVDEWYTGTVYTAGNSHSTTWGSNNK